MAKFLSAQILGRVLFALSHPASSEDESSAESTMMANRGEH